MPGQRFKFLSWASIAAHNRPTSLHQILWKSAVSNRQRMVTDPSRGPPRHRAPNFTAARIASNDLVARSVTVGSAVAAVARILFTVEGALTRTHSESPRSVTPPGIATSIHDLANARHDNEEENDVHDDHDRPSQWMDATIAHDDRQRSTVAIVAFDR